MANDLTAQELYSALRDRLNDGLPWREISVEFGTPVQELCDFILAYREPAKALQRAGQYIIPHKPAVPTHRAMARKFEQWRKSRRGENAMGNLATASRPFGLSNGDKLPEERR